MPILDFDLRPIFGGNDIMKYQVFGNEIQFILFFFLLSLMGFFISKRLTNIIIKKLSQNEKFLSKEVLKNIFDLFKRRLRYFIKLLFIYVGSLFLNFYEFQKYVDVLFHVFIFIPLFFFAIEIGKFFLDDFIISKKRIQIDKAAYGLLIKVFNILIFSIAVIFIFSLLGYDVTALIAGLGIGGLAVALAAQDILKNFFGGVSVIFDKTFNKGERIKIADVDGMVEEVNLRTTKIKTLDGSLITLPNSIVSDNKVENLTKIKKVKISMKIGLEYNHSSKDLERAKKALIQIANENEKTIKDWVYVWFSGYGDFSLDLWFICYGDIEFDDWDNRMKYIDDINFAIKKRFEKEKLVFAFPTRTIEMKKVK